MAGAVGAPVIRFRLYFLLLPALLAVHDVKGQSGTTPGIRDIFVERCDAFQKQRPVIFENNPKNCTLLWNAFFNSFANKESCMVEPSSYSSFLLEANHTAAIKDKAMFWAFVSPFVYNYTAYLSGKYVTILDLLAGHILNDLKWCWNSTKNDLDYTSCPFYKDCPYGNEAVRSFWKANSESFAGLATGKVYAMLNGSTDIGAYSNRSIFYTDEVPAMRNPPIQIMQAILVHNPGGPIRDYCINGTLEVLKNQLNAKGIDFKCIQDEPTVKLLQCRLYPYYARYCTGNGAPSKTLSPTTSSQVSVAIILLVAKFLYYGEVK